MRSRNRSEKIVFHEQVTVVNAGLLYEGFWGEAIRRSTLLGIEAGRS